MWSAAVQGVVQEPRVWGGAAHAVQSLQESGLTEVWGGAAHAARSSPVVKPATDPNERGCTPGVRLARARAAAITPQADLLRLLHDLSGGPLALISLASSAWLAAARNRTLHL